MKLRKRYEELIMTFDANLFNQRLREFQDKFCWSGFVSKIPIVKLNSDLDIVLSYHGYEMSIETALDYMENVGYITPDDFFL